MPAHRLPRRHLWTCLACALVLPAVFTGNAAADTFTFTNPNPITVPATGPSPVAASPYPSQMSFAGVNGNATKVTLNLQNVTHTYPDDLDLILEGPLGKRMIPMSDVGGSGDVNIDLTFDDAAPNSLPDNTLITGGTYKPTNFPPADTVAPGAPAPPFADNLATFNGADPDGTWRLWVSDDFGPADGGTIAGGWSLEITTPVPSSPTQQPNAPSPPRPALRSGACANAQRGSNGRDVLNGTRRGDRLRGLGGSDRLRGRGGKDCLSGGSGNDSLSGGSGNDRLSGGSGRNRYSGGPGNDRINARNGRAERVSCGSGRDRVRADRGDTLIGC